jgi:DNA/RNA endonuclease YhcR with UshA esterase domain
MLRTLARWKTTMLAVSAVLFVGLLASRHLVGPLSNGGPVAGPLPAVEAKGHVGERAEVCGTVVEGVQISDLDGAPTFLNLGAPHPDQNFTALIWESDRKKWASPPETLYEGQSICVSGTVELHKGTPQIIVSSPGQIREQ